MTDFDYSPAHPLGFDENEQLHPYAALFASLTAITPPEIFTVTEDVKTTLTMESFNKLQSMLINKIQEKSEEQCSICLEQFHTKQQYILLPKCTHKFHKMCLREWVTQYSHYCPNCRLEINGETTQN